MTRHQIEIRQVQKYHGKLLDGGKVIIDTVPLDKIIAILENTDKRLYSQYADGCTIFHLTERQYNKLKKLTEEFSK